MTDPFQVYTALVLGASGILTLSLAVVATLHVRSLSDDVLRSRMFLKSHLLRRGYFLLIFTSAGLLVASVPLLLGAVVPWIWVLAAAIVGLGALDLAVVTLYFVVAPREPPLAATWGRVADFLRRFHD